MLRPDRSITLAYVPRSAKLMLSLWSAAAAVTAETAKLLLRVWTLSQPLAPEASMALRCRSSQTDVERVQSSSLHDLLHNEVAGRSA